MFQRAFMRMSAKSLKTGKGTFMSIIFGAHILRFTTPLRCLFSCFSYSAFILLSIEKAWTASRDFVEYFGLVYATKLPQWEIVKPV
ncbi:hypothetical protein DEH81_15760 [Pectobacterium zantedeschiae]|uniref:Uncharacterized protein n=1 Tax=Pectobacterium zantedeschiae TaxID=2034769 RepID=A0A9X8JHY5_9GAMM|nr:hypothetical protein CTN06_16150 [Pectobacterium zantedeschiae]RYC40379.1 hypothetical protein DEH81_15760 [Pectobacterium zantedeschiae]RYC40656.1 hypothetical protein CLR69_17670 [Pectobacterium zantedeschiae]